jgi:hypothetical protein
MCYHMLGPRYRTMHLKAREPRSLSLFTCPSSAYRSTFVNTASGSLQRLLLATPLQDPWPNISFMRSPLAKLSHYTKLFFIPPPRKALIISHLKAHNTSKENSKAIAKETLPNIYYTLHTIEIIDPKCQGVQEVPQSSVAFDKVLSIRNRLLP